MSVNLSEHHHQWPDLRDQVNEPNRPRKDDNSNPGYLFHLEDTNRISSPSLADSEQASVYPHNGDDVSLVPSFYGHPSEGPPATESQVVPHYSAQNSQKPNSASGNQKRKGLPSQEERLNQAQDRPPESDDNGGSSIARGPRAKHAKADIKESPTSRKNYGTVTSPRLSRLDSRQPRSQRGKPTRIRRPQPDPAYTSKTITKTGPPCADPDPSAFASKDVVQVNPTDHKDDDEEAIPQVLLQPETRPISHGQLVVEVRGIYAGLVMVEAKCIDVDDKQAAAARDHPSTRRHARLSSEQWRALIALHKTLLHEHHDFFLASRHPAASPMLSGLAEKYAMPARLWRHGIYGFLEVLRHHLPDSLDHMLAFIYIAYSMIALLYETALGFESTWIEALGDLSRYRMAIETEDMETRQIWSNVSKSWYNKAVDRDPKIGRLHHHLAILEKPFSIQQLSKFAVSLTCVTPFANAHTSILSLFVPVLEGRASVRSRADPVHYYFVKTHAIIYTSQHLDQLQDCVSALIDGSLVEKCIRREKERFRDVGIAMALANVSAMLGYGQMTSDGHSLGVLRLLVEQQNALHPATTKPRSKTKAARGKEIINSRGSHHSSSTIDDLSSAQLVQAQNKLAHAAAFSFKLFSVVLRQGPDRHAAPTVHVYLAFIRFLAIKAPRAMADVRDYIPWKELVDYLNRLLKFFRIKPSTFVRDSFPATDKKSRIRPLVEDYALRGLVFTTDYPHPSYFEHEDSDYEERLIEHASMHIWRTERILWLAHKIAGVRTWITFDEKKVKFASTGFWQQLEAPRLRSSKSEREADTDMDSIMSEAGSARDSDVAMDSASSRTLSMHSLRSSDIAMESPSSKATSTYDGHSPAANTGEDTRHVTRARTARDVDMSDEATQRGRDTFNQGSTETERDTIRVPSKFELQGIDPENYPIKIQDGSDEISISQET